MIPSPLYSVPLSPVWKNTEYSLFTGFKTWYDALLWAYFPFIEVDTKISDWWEAYKTVFSSVTSPGLTDLQVHALNL